MSRKTVLISLSVVVVIIAIVGGGFFLYINNLMQFKPLSISYATVQTNKPDGASCLGDGDNPGIAKEILNLESDDIFVAGGDKAITDDVWKNFNVSLPYIKNSTRHLMFDLSCFFRSPDAVADCDGESCFTKEVIFDYSWLKLTTVAGQSCFPDASGCSGQTVKPGYVSITTIAKCHEITWSGPLIYDLSDGNGNKYIMHATETGQPDIEHVILPTGWTLETRVIDQPLTLLPFGGEDNCYYNVLRDNVVQSYHQYEYSTVQYPPAS